MPKRKAISKKLRFEVFKRDGFTCQYCGKSAPDVVLNVDHIKPVNSGGDNNILNLATSCFDCNSGKGKRELTDSAVIDKQRQQLDELNEKRLQMEMMVQWRESLLESKNLLERSLLKQAGSYFHLDEEDEKQALKAFKKHLSEHSYDAVSQALEDLIPNYECFDHLLKKLKGYLYIKSLPSDEQELYYIRGILKKRCSYLSGYRDYEILDVLKDVLHGGVAIEVIKDCALNHTGSLEAYLVKLDCETAHLGEPSNVVSIRKNEH